MWTMDDFVALQWCSESLFEISKDLKILIYILSSGKFYEVTTT